MSTQATRIVRIEKDGRQKAVSEAAYKHMKMAHLEDQTYEGAGWTIVSYEDGTPYGEGVEPTQYAIASAAPAIGESASSATTIDGEPATDAHLAAAGIKLAEAPTPTRHAQRGASADVVSTASVPVDVPASPSTSTSSVQ